MPKEEATPIERSALAVRRSTDMAALVDLEDALRNGRMEADDVIDDPEQISRQIIEELLGAETDEELESVGTAVGWLEYLGVPMEIQGFRWRKSDYTEGAPFYFIVSAIDLRDGEHVIVTTGSKNVIAALINLGKRDRLPCVRVLAQAEKPTTKGYYPQFLVSTPEEAAARKADRIATREAGE